LCGVLVGRLVINVVGIAGIYFLCKKVGLAANADLAGHMLALDRLGKRCVGFVVVTTEGV